MSINVPPPEFEFVPNLRSVGIEVTEESSLISNATVKGLACRF